MTIIVALLAVLVPRPGWRRRFRALGKNTRSRVLCYLIFLVLLIPCGLAIGWAFRG